MLKTVRVTKKVSQQSTVYVGKVAAEKMEKQTFSDAIKFLLDHYVVFPPEMISKIQELIENKHLGFFSKGEFLYEAARSLLKHYSENIEYIQVHSYLYEKTKNAIEDLNFPFMGVDDFVEEQLKKLHEQHDQWKEQKEAAERS
jgi:hypothetical protein